MASATDRYYAESKRGAQLRKDAFKKYIEKHELMEKINAAVGALFNEAVLPDNPMDYVASHLCADKLKKADESLEKMKELEKEVKKLRSEVRTLKG
mmetsp:Transcript_4163/g.7613  ORF Transcript_4163/g.7613 Transcript_4163/m.7613 type:complete len:96 (-) Transcript_4163:1111-1398(-)